MDPIFILTPSHDDDDDVIFVKEVNATFSDFYIKIGETEDFPINCNGDNRGLLKSNPIVID